MLTFTLWQCFRRMIKSRSGLQAEQRTFWDAPEVYAAMAPFNNANKIDKPILLIHGEADNNSGADWLCGAFSKYAVPCCTHVTLSGNCWPAVVASHRA